MSATHVFAIANGLALAAWVVLAASPRRPWVSDVLCGRVLPALFGVIYLAIIVTQWAGSPGGFSSLDDVALLFSNPWLLLAGWVHYLAFDLFVGSWEVRDARMNGIPQLLVVPCLALTFLFGPAGWLLYLGVRSVRRVAR